MGKSGDTTIRTASDQRAAAREARLAEQLRANLLRRKQQARARRAGDADQRDGIGPTGERDAE